MGWIDLFILELCIVCTVVFLESVFFIRRFHLEALIWSLNVWKAFPINTDKGPLDCLNKYSNIFYHTELHPLNDEFIFDSTLFKCDYSLYLIV